MDVDPDRSGVVIIPFHVSGPHPREGMPARSRVHLLELHGWREEDLEADEHRVARRRQAVARELATHDFDGPLPPSPTTGVAHWCEHREGISLPVPHVHIDGDDLETLERFTQAMALLEGDVAPHPFGDACFVLAELTETLRATFSGEELFVPPWEDRDDRGRS